jgi:DNA-binding transcriptional LysR family regulator
MLERHEVEAFLAVAEELHFGRAAERLRVSTTRVSQIIRGLERRVGAPLFERTSRRVLPTPIGRQLYCEISPAWSELTAAVERAVASARGFAGTLRVAFVGAAAGQLVMQIAERFRTAHPECEVLVREAQLADVGPWLAGAEADVVLGALPPDSPGLTSGGTLVSEARMLAVPSSGAGRRRGPVTGPGATFQELLTLVGAGRGTLEVGAHVRRYYTRPDVAYELLDGAPPVEWGLIWRADAATARVLAFNRAALDLVGRPGG